MSSIFGDYGRQTDPSTPVALSPQAASGGGPDDGTDDDSGGLDISFFIGLNASIGKLADSVQADMDRRNKFQPPQDNPLFQSGVFPASGDLTLDLGSVPLGRVWQIRRLIVGGATVTTTAAGAAYAFAQGAPPADVNLTNCVDIFLTLPQGNTYGTHQLFLLPSAHLWVVFAGGTAGQQYAAAAQVESWDEASFKSTFAE
jgi:hypothetical protein